MPLLSTSSGFNPLGKGLSLFPNNKCPHPFNFGRFGAGFWTPLQNSDSRLGFSIKRPFIPNQTVLVPTMLRLKILILAWVFLTNAVSPQSTLSASCRAAAQNYDSRCRFFIKCRVLPHQPFLATAVQRPKIMIPAE